MRCSVLGTRNPQMAWDSFKSAPAGSRWFLLIKQFGMDLKRSNELLMDQPVQMAKILALITKGFAKLITMCFQYGLGLSNLSRRYQQVNITNHAKAQIFLS
jgi:hypothetical protein